MTMDTKELNKLTAIAQTKLLAKFPLNNNETVLKQYLGGWLTTEQIANFNQIIDDDDDDDISDKTLLLYSQMRLGIYRYGGKGMKIFLIIVGVVLGTILCGIIASIINIPMLAIVGAIIGGFVASQMREKSIKERLFIPISEIRQIIINDKILTLHFYNLKSINLYLGKNLRSFNHFLELLISLRTTRFAHQAFECMTAGYSSLDRQQIQEALKYFDKAASIEHFHPGPHLMRCLVLTHLGQGKQASKELTIASLKTAYMSEAIQGYIPDSDHSLYSQFPLFINLWLESCFSTAQIYYLAEVLGIDLCSEKQNTYQLIFSALLSSRLKQWEQAANLLEIAAQKEKSSTLNKEIVVFGSKLLASSEVQQLSLPSASRFIKPVDNNQDNNENYLAPIDPSLGKLSQQDTQAFTQILSSYYYKLDNRLKVKKAWSLLRSNRLQEAQQAIAMSPEILYKQIAGGYRPEEPTLWLSALLGTELLLKQGKKAGGRILIESAYPSIASAIKNTTDPYLANATALFGLYSALANDDRAISRLYLNVFANLEGFDWVRTLVTDLIPDIFTRAENFHGDQTRLLSEFTTWLEQTANHSSLRNKPDLAKAVSRFREVQAREKVSVVVGGETSAGKSSFLNALLEVKILHTAHQEATAIPTHISSGASWLATAYKQDSSPQIYDEEGYGSLDTLKEFIRQHSFLGSQDSLTTTRLIIEAPISSLAKDVEFVDTPGLNAHQERTDKAEDIIEFAHACIFVIDARNALKAGEMKKIIWASEAVGKTIFVINKIDLIVGDDELDCDDNAVEEVLERVRDELCQTLKVPEVNLFAVSSLSGSQVDVDFPYVDSISDVRHKLEQILGGSRERLIAYTATKVAHLSSETALNYVLNEVTKREAELSMLASGMPEDPETFREYIYPRLLKVWPVVRDGYINNMQSHLESARNKLYKDLASDIQRCQNNEQFKSFIGSGLKRIVDNFVSTIESHRNKEWERSGTFLLQYSTDFFRALYREVEFEHQFDADRLLHLATPLPLTNKIRKLIKTTETKLQDAANQTMGTAAAGAVIGMVVLGPLGALAGTVIGGAMGGGINEQAIKEILVLVDQEVQKIIVKVTNAMERDLKSSNPDHLPPMLQAIFDNVEEERQRFESLVTKRIDQVRAKLAQVEEDAQKERRLALESSEWANKFDTFLLSSKFRADS